MVVLREVRRTSTLEQSRFITERKKSVRPQLPGTGPSGASHKWRQTLIFRTILSVAEERFLCQPFQRIQPCLTVTVDRLSTRTIRHLKCTQRLEHQRQRNL